MSQDLTPSDFLIIPAKEKIVPDDSLSNLGAKVGGAEGTPLVGDLTLASGANIKLGQTAYNTGTGFWLGDDSGTTKLSIGNPSGNYLIWDGSSLTVSGITLTGGTLKYSKTSFSDSTNAGYYLGSEGIYFGAASDATKLKYTISDGTFDFIGTISSRSTATIASAINSLGNFIDDNLRTDTLQILDGFKLTASGALNISGTQTSLTVAASIGDTSITVSDTTGFPTSGVFYLQGNTNWMRITYTGKTGTTITGIPASSTGSITEASAIGKEVIGGPGLILTPKGLVAINSSGVETITLEGATGSATFAGTLSAASGTLKSITLTDDLGNNRVVVPTSGYAFKFYTVGGTYEGALQAGEDTGNSWGLQLISRNTAGGGDTPILSIGDTNIITYKSIYPALVGGDDNDLDLGGIIGGIDHYFRNINYKGAMIGGSATFNSDVKVNTKLGLVQIGGTAGKYIYLQGSAITDNLTYTLPTALPASPGGIFNVTNAGIMGVLTPQVYETSGNNTWTKPAGITWVQVILVGAGGGGGGATADISGGGGGGGSIVSFTFKADDITSPVTVAVGAGGTAGAEVTGGNGGVGGNTTFGSYLTSYGGGGGIGGGTNGNAGGGAGSAGAGSGSTGGTPRATASNGISGQGVDGVAMSGGNPGVSGYNAEYGGAGGGSGVNATGKVGGAGGSSLFSAGAGGGGAKLSTSDTGNPGTTGGIYQGGGGGGTATIDGGAGGNHQTYVAGGGGAGGTGSGVSGNGGTGGARGGGGGGGASLSTGGWAGGAGGVGFAIVVCF